MCERQKKGRQRERARETVTGTDTMKIWSSQQFSQSVRECSLCSDCAAEHLNHEMSCVLYVSDALVLTGAQRKRGWRAV